MNTNLMKHTNLIIRIKKNGLDVQLIKLFPLDKIIKCCEKVETIGVKSDDYKKNEVFQQELVKDENFILYLNKIYENKLNIDGFQTLLEDIREHNDKISNYPINNIINILNNTKLLKQAYYSYLKYFLDYTNNSELNKIITNNLNYFYQQSDTKFDELSEKERELLKTSILDSYNLIPIKTIKKSYEFLANNEELRNFITFLDNQEMYIPLEFICKNFC